MSVTYKYNSNLKSTPVRDERLDLYVPPFRPDFTQTQQVEITQKYHQRPDILALDLYDDSNFWWVFTLYNRNQLLDPIRDMKLGLTILAPTKNFITGL